MACTNCKDTISGYCKVCQLLDDDTSIKKVTYCVVCGVYICGSCNKDLMRRWEAFLLKSGIKKKRKRSRK